MENIVAVAMINKKGTKYYFLTWGRILDIIDDRQIIHCVKKHAVKCDVEKPIVGGYLCDDLQEASGQMYFYEAFFKMAQERIPTGKNYKKWQTKMAKELKKGNEIRYLGNPKAPWKHNPPLIRKV